MGADVLADFWYVGQEVGHSAVQQIGLDAPEPLAGAFDPNPVRCRRAEPKQPGLPGFLIGEEFLKIAADLSQDLLASLGHARAAFDQLRCFFGEIVRQSAGLLVGKLLATDRGISRRARTPN